MNRIIHFEIMADDPERAAEFYRKVFSWVFKKWDQTAVDYWLVTTGPEGEPGIDGGMSKREKPGPCECHSAFLCTVGVRSIDESTEKIIAAGGSITRPKMEIKSVGLMAMCKDTEGNNFGILEATPPSEPAECDC